MPTLIISERFNLVYIEGEQAIFKDLYAESTFRPNEG